jgi:hypothetical protein
MRNELAGAVQKLIYSVGIVFLVIRLLFDLNYNDIDRRARFLTMSFRQRAVFWKKTRPMASFPFDDFRKKGSISSTHLNSLKPSFSRRTFSNPLAVPRNPPPPSAQG